MSFSPDIDRLFEELRSDPETGLDESESASRLEEFGPNRVHEAARRGPWRILIDQFVSAIVALLVVAAAISAYLGEYKDTVAIGAILLLNAILGFVQEYRADRAIAALAKLAVPRVKVRRKGQWKEISAETLVPGDVVRVESGDLVPADGRLFEVGDLRLEESALTGESEPVCKAIDQHIDEHEPIGDRLDMVFLGTKVAHGRGVALVTETGMKTELGRIAHLLQSVDVTATPLQRRLGRLGRLLAIIALAIVTVVFVLGVLRGEAPRLMLLTAMSLAVAVVPEGLPAVTTVTLALGAKRMLEKQALIRKLPAVETLGSVTVICADKTGTLTENRMSVETVYVDDEAVAAKNLDQGELSESATLLLVGAVLSNDATIETQHDEHLVLGDPTEVALVEQALACGFRKDLVDGAFERIAEIPFDSERKRMTTVHRASARVEEQDGRRILPFEEGDVVAWCKGGAESLLDVSTTVRTSQGVVPLDGALRRELEQAHDELAERGLRVLAVAYRRLQSEPTSEELANLERDLVFVGMVGMTDPLRPEAEGAVGRCQTAGIRPMMITGDHPRTAQRIGKDLGLMSDEPPMTGVTIEQMGAEELAENASRVSAFARVSPEHKLRIVNALRDRGHVVAMTGDGVNDAPALRAADIGVAMGKIGTDVAKEAADMVLLDDNFATIVDAVEEGRTIFSNVRKFLRYTMTSNAGEVLVMIGAPFLGLPLALLPLQILWINLVTDGLPGLALAVEPGERGAMVRPPISPDRPILDRPIRRDILWTGSLMAAVSLGTALLYRGDGTDEVYWRTVLFTVLTLSQMGNALTIRSERDSLLKIGLLSNKTMLLAVLITFGLQLAVVYLPALQTVFRTTSLEIVDLGVCLVASSLVFGVGECKKLLRRAN